MKKTSILVAVKALTDALKNQHQYSGEKAVVLILYDDGTGMVRESGIGQIMTVFLTPCELADYLVDNQKEL